MDDSAEGTHASWLDDLLSETPEAATERASTALDADLRGFDKRIVLFGAGNMGRRTLARLRQDGIEPLAFADNQSAQWGKSVDGLDVLPPKEAAAHYGRDAVFIVTIYNNRHRFPDTRDQLLELGCARAISVISLRWKYNADFLPYYHDDLPAKVLLQADAIREAYALWADEPSQREFVAQIAWRLHGDFDVLGKPDPEGEYFPKGLIRRRADEFFVDVGAYDGDTIRMFLSHQGTEFDRVLALEPDTENYKRLAAYVSSAPAHLSGRIQARPLAASNRAGRLRFNNGEGLAASLNEAGSTEVECARLDDLLQGLHPTYIKMDIEGAELDAIEGSTRILTVDRPVLAVCVYHTQDHLWKVPVAVRKLQATYRFFLRPHMQECWDTVCYAVPPDRVL